MVPHLQFGRAPCNWGTDAMQQADRLAAGSVLLLLLYVDQARRHAGEGAWGGDPIFGRCLVLQQCSPIPNGNNPAAASRHCCAASVPSRQRPSRDVIAHSGRATISHTTQHNPYDPIMLDSPPASHLPNQSDRHGSHQTRPRRSQVLLTSHSWDRTSQIQDKTRQDKATEGF